MCKKNPNFRALRLLHSFCPSYFPLLIAKSFFEKLSPYFNLYLSAEIVNEIIGARNKENLIVLILITVLGNFIIAIIGGLLRRVFGHKETLLYHRENVFYNKKTLFLDYTRSNNSLASYGWFVLRIKAMIDAGKIKVVYMCKQNFFKTIIKLAE